MTSGDEASFLDTELRRDYINEDHILAFAKALEADDLTALQDDSSPSIPGTPRPAHAERIRKVSALSDFAPINQRVKRRRRGLLPPRRRELLYHIVRWPLLGLLFLVIFFEFYAYVWIRQCVNALEWLLAWRGKKGKLRANLRQARTYEEWKEAARVMDEYLGFEEWKQDDEDPYYDWTLVKKVYRSLRSFRAKDDARGVMGVLEVCIRANFAGIESTRIYSETFLGTKNLIESYLDEVTAALVYIRETSQLSPEEKRRFFRSANKNLGASALCLSGGASFGYYHFGVVRAFLDAGQLPRVVAGTSAGGLVAALVCTRTDDELKELLVPKLAERITACEDPFRVWWRRFRVTGARFDTPQWARKACWFTRGSLTFREAYQRTGRVLNISVIPFDQHSPTKLLNHLTAPDCLIWSAIIASAAVPGILNPVVLMQKTKSGTIVPWNYGSRFKDGSLRVDIPLQSLNLLFNVNHPIVSQVNPHVHLFFFAPRGSAGKPVAHRKGKGWRGGFLLSAAEQYLKLELTKNFKVIRDLELLPRLLGQDWSGVFTQKFEGSVTIWPRTRLTDWLNILSDPDEAELERMMSVGKRVTWPKLHLIENRTRLEREIYKGRKAFRQTPIRSSAPDVDLGADAGPSTNEVLSPPANQNKKFDLREFAGGTLTGMQAKNKLLDLDGDQDGTDEQLPVDSEAERGFATGSQEFFKRPHRHHHFTRDVSAQLRAHENGMSLRPPPKGGRRSPSPSLRHRYHGSPPLRAPSPRPAHQRSPSFMERLRKSPLSALSSLRSRSPATRNTVRDDDGWSESTSSSEEEEWVGGASPANFRKAVDLDEDL
ncbi:acyl transferase/acyl hydrolase/lysophospholipase [Rhizoctonia solani]|nr:acyl transferase/acyl hydrolase/lysophospholipase [Rhizoctonia solani]